MAVHALCGTPRRLAMTGWGGGGDIGAGGYGGDVACRARGWEQLLAEAYQELARILDGCGMDHLLLKGPHMQGNRIKI